MRTARREKAFGPGRAVPLDGNAEGPHSGVCAGLERPEPPAGPSLNAHGNRSTFAHES